MMGKLCPGIRAPLPFLILICLFSSPLLAQENLTVDLAAVPTRKGGPPGYEHKQVFAPSEKIWLGLDPASIPPSLPDPCQAAVFLISAGEKNGVLLDLSGGPETVTLSKTNPAANVVLVAPAGLPPGDYEVVLDFGNQSSGGFQQDSRYDPGIDLLDGGAQAGFTVLADPAARGSHSFQTYHYPSPQLGSPLFTDIGDFVFSLDQKVLMKGIMPDSVPLEGHVFLPNTGTAPLVLIVHGNTASVETPSDSGWFYLCEHLASHGFAAVAIDQSFLNGTNITGEMDGRAVVILRHLQLFREWNSTSGHPLNGKIDLNRIGLAGHSRGGEAVVTASFFNTQFHNPNDPEFDFNFDIEAVYNIAATNSHIYEDENPKDNLNPYFSPAPPLNTAAFGLMQGSHDGDEPCFLSQQVYDRAHPVLHPLVKGKTMQFVHGLNHRNFNTVNQFSEIEETILPDTFSISAQQQRTVLKHYLTAFFNNFLMGEEVYTPVLAGDYASDSLPASMTVLHQYQDTMSMFLNHYEEDQRANTGSLDQIKNKNLKNGIKPLEEGFLQNMNGFPWVFQETHGLQAGWEPGPKTKIPVYAIDLPNGLLPNPNPYTCLSLRIGQAFEDPGQEFFNSRSKEMKFSAKLIFDSGESLVLNSADFDALPYPQEAKDDFFNVFHKSILSTVRFPLEAFTAGMQVNWSNLERVELIFDQTETGYLIVDDIQFTR